MSRIKTFCDKCQIRRILYLEIRDILLFFNEINTPTFPLIKLTHGPYDFGVPCMTDKDAFSTLLTEPSHLMVNLGD